MCHRFKKWLQGHAVRALISIAKYSAPEPRPVPILTRCADLFGWRAFIATADLQQYECVQLWRLSWPKPITCFPEVLTDGGERPGLFWRPHSLPAVNRDALSFSQTRH